LSDHTVNPIVHEEVVRVASEALTNAVRHAATARAWRRRYSTSGEKGISGWSACVNARTASAEN
jgi:hypothetical protein